MNNIKGTESSHIVLKGDTPTGHTLYGDADAIIQVRQCQYVTLQDLNILGEVQNIPLQDAWDARFLFRRNGSDVTEQREDKDATPEEIKAKDGLYEDLRKETIQRPSYFSTVGLLIASSRYVNVKNNVVGYMPGTGLRVQSSDFVTVEGNHVHNSSRRSSIGNHGMVIHSATTNVKNMGFVEYAGYRISILGNTVHNNYNEVYSWSSLKTLIHPEIDEGKGITVQKTNSNFNSSTGRILVANNVVYKNGFSGVHLNFAKNVDIYHNTAVNNDFTGSGNKCGISVTGSSKVNVMNNIAVAINDFACPSYATDDVNLDGKEIVFSSNLAIGEFNEVKMPSELFLFSTLQSLGLSSAEEGYRISNGSSATGAGDASILPVVPLDFNGNSRSNPPDLGAHNVDLDSTFAPTVSFQPTMTPPTPAPTRCLDNSDKFVSNNGKMRTCTWAAKKTKRRCKKLNVAEQCPVVCSALTASCKGDSQAPSAAPFTCNDNSGEFLYKEGKIRTCEWVAKKILKRCKRAAPENCPTTCQVDGC